MNSNNIICVNFCEYRNSKSKMRFKFLPSSVLVGTYRMIAYIPELGYWVGWKLTANGCTGTHAVMDDFGTLVPVGERVHARNPFHLGVKLGNLNAHFEH